ncbi:CHAT domain-containing protein [Pseudanabaena yagii]|uniref:Tetratricopeptide repeat protein n=1 Tax=Pseudanabaena yagii GIHE-NHR1 TaxID=2722753 RepID=A0ABX1LQQ6_9CYAN|nr:tetratricopeptide repeat protein [Pseudanabaena yagii]NMF57676.1 tetratricopeptide repeat protein [Pseudanabaena yagii GIHE-NHR1]
MNRLISLAIAALLSGLPMPIAIAESVQTQTVQDRKAEAARLFKQGAQLYRTSRYREAIQVWESALGIYREIKNRNGEAISLRSLGLAYSSLGQYQKAIDLYQQSLEIVKLIGDRNSEAILLSDLGSSYKNIGDYLKAISFYQQSLAIKKQIRDPFDEREILDNLGNAYTYLGEYQKANDFYQQSLAITREIKDRRSEGSVLSNIGSTYNSLGQYEKAIDFYQKSLDIAREVGDRRSEGSALSNLGFAYNSLGKYQKSIEHHQKSLDIYKQIGDKNGEGQSLNSLGNVYEAIGQYQKAIDFYQQSLVIKKQIGDKNGEGNSLNNLGNVYNVLENYSKAIEYFEQSLLIFRNIGNSIGESASINNLGNAYAAIGKHLEAIKSYQASLSIVRKNNDSTQEGKLLNNLGNAHTATGQYQKAIDYFQKSLSIKKRIGDRAGEGKSFSNLGELFVKLNQPELAILFYKQSVNVRETIRKDIIGLTKEEKKSYLSTIEKDYRALADLLLKQDRILEAQQVLDLLKVQELSNYLRTVRGNNQTSQGVDLQRPEQNIIAYANELNQLQQKDREGKLNETEQQRLSQLVQSERDQNKQFNAFLDSPQIKKLITELRRNEDNQNVDIAKYRRLQKDLLSQFPNAVLLYPLILDDRLELVILNANTSPLRRTVNIKREQLNQLIIDLRAELQDSGSEDVKQTSQKLYSILIKPFENELSQLKINTIIYAPDGILRYIPLAALYDGKQWLVEKYRVNNITAESLTAFNSKAIANPRIFAGAFGGKGGEIRSGFSGLPASIPEVQKITSLFPNTTSLIEKDFTKKVTADRANSHTILHLATHGELLVGTPEDSFIVFGNGEKVTIGELKDWDLKNVDLVVLSACQSGLGSKLGTGIEVLGLGYQMQAAGARVAIASLWTVDDAGTQALMDAFYTELKKGNLSVVEALSRAQISLIKSDKYNHPRFWSAFFAIGNGL